MEYIDLEYIDLTLAMQESINEYAMTCRIINWLLFQMSVNDFKIL